MWEGGKSQHNFGRNKVCKAEKVGKHFVNTKLKNEGFS